MAVLAARKHYCTNHHVCKKVNLDEECKVLLKDPNKACAQFKNVHKLKNHVSLQKGGCHETHDIEDLVNLAHSVKGCAYFASRAMAADACIVFCPYSYILNPIFRKAMDVDIRGAIVVFDEAHNIEDISREAGSVDLQMSLLEDLRNELELLSSTEESTDIYHPLFEMIQELLIWIRHKEDNLSRREVDHFYGSWSGPKALEQLQAAGISKDSFSILLDCAVKAAGAAANPDPENSHLSGRAASTLEGLFASLKFMLSKPEYMYDYQLVLHKFMKKEDGAQEWIYTLSFWCLNPGVVFDEIATTSKSVILTSGTLSPMGSFASELGATFEVSMEAPHIINMDTQILVSVISVGPTEIPLNASYQHADTAKFQDELGAALEQICNVVPDGALVFFPSYKLLQKVCNRWRATGQWKRISDSKKLFVETRGTTESFEEILNGYYNVIKKDAVISKGHLKQSRKPGSTSSSASGNGAAFLAVCRGKVSEGINFSDENARVVVVVGIPFPNLKDVQVNMKKHYNDAQKNSKQLLGGDQWYCYQAFRAVNQAVGRCIRHRGDFGSILLLDERYNKPSYNGFMSKWLRNSVRKPGCFEEALKDLQLFFSKFKDTSFVKCLLDAPKPFSASLLQSSPNQELSLKSRSPVQEQHSSTNCDLMSMLPTLSDLEYVPETVPYSVSAAADAGDQGDVQMRDESNTRNRKDYFLFCCKCRHYLGASENLSLACHKEMLRKTYLTSLANATSPALSVIIVEASCLNRFLFENSHGEAFQRRQGTVSGIWVEADGCVFKPIICGWCTDSVVVLGVRVLAADPANMQYAGKVILFQDFLSVSESEYPNGTGACSVATPKRTSLTLAKGKLKLRRKEF